MEKQYIKKQLSAAYRYSYVRLALNYYTFYEEMCENNGISEQTKEYSLQFNRILKGFMEGGAELFQLDQLRDQIIKTIETISIYTECFEIYEYVFNRMERRFRDGVKITESVEELSERLMEFLMSSKDSVVMNERIQQVIGELPVRFTRQKFYTMLFDGLSVYTGSEKESLENMMYLLRTVTMVRKPEHMDQEYRDLYEISEQFKQADYRHMEQAEFRNCMVKIKYATDKLLGDIGIYLLFQDLINDLYVLMLTEQSAMMDLYEKQTLEKIVNSVLEKFLAGNTSFVEADITKLLYELEGKQESAMERYQSYPAPEEDSEDESVKLVKTVDRLLSGSFFAELIEDEDQETGVADRAFIEQKTSEFIKELDQVFAESSKPVVRAIMAKLLSSLPLAFDTLDDFQAYVSGSLGSCSDRAERECCMELLDQVMIDEDALV